MSEIKFPYKIIPSSASQKWGMEGVVVHLKAILQVLHSLHCPQYILLFSLSVTEVSISL